MIGEVIGKFRLVREIGSGGMGQVFLGEHIELPNLRAAVKVLRPEVSTHPEIARRFVNEARAATAFEHPSLVGIYDAGEHNGRWYIAMEFLRGETLAAKLRREGRLSPELAIDVMLQVARAMAAAHKAGVIHRDLKPDNLFLVLDEEIPCKLRVKVLDFGIAKLVEDTGIRTHTNLSIGTPAYMSPEQCRSAGRADARSDIYSFGCILFELLTGRTPFVCEEMGDYFQAHWKTDAPSPRSFIPTIKEALEALVLRCLAKFPPNRYQSMESLALNLEQMPRPSAPMLSWSDVTVAPAAPAGALHTPALTPPMPAATAPDRPEALRAAANTTMGGAASEAMSRPRRSRRLAWGGGVVVLVAAASITIVVTLMNTSRKPTVMPAGVQVPADARPPTTATQASAAPSSAEPPVSIDAGPTVRVTMTVDAAVSPKHKDRERSRGSRRATTTAPIPGTLPADDKTKATTLDDSQPPTKATTHDDINLDDIKRVDVTDN